jgi:hypothetical protein
MQLPKLQILRSDLLLQDGQFLLLHRTEGRRLRTTQTRTVQGNTQPGPNRRHSPRDIADDVVGGGLLRNLREPGPEILEPLRH